MDMKHLIYFVEVARQKSFSKAADTAYVSQSTVSKLIKDLETHLGVTLFNRNSKYVELTDAGEILFNKAQHLVSLYESIVTDFTSEIKLAKGKIFIGLPPITGATDFAQLLGKFRKAYPNIEIILHEYGSKKIEQAVQDGSLDIGVALTCTPINNQNLEMLSFTNDPLEVVVHHDNPLSKFTEINLTSLADEFFILYRNDFSLHDEIINRCKIAGFQPKIMLETSDRELMTQIVASNLGIALMPSKICKRLRSPNLVCIPLEDPKILLHTSIIWNKHRYLSYATRLWLNFAKEHLV